MRRRAGTVRRRLSGESSSAALQPTADVGPLTDVHQATTAYDLKKVWPELTLHIVPDAGHSSREPGIAKLLVKVRDFSSLLRHRPRARNADAESFLPCMGQLQATDDFAHI